ncbi:unnamed protein product [Acanthoscelides obtectus]|uniref:Uncharacterized protein n=1 Tax=Acanthoscelides obtectus TaxID=200917 RepID=A0A9P0K6B9_ACAOB|nr:unnamed protein product [Acanthoscelides obtectus]CAK1628746.1 hypothetical protein AOBTE_LOCUS5379 [Acanthoscelides obtectus]
MTGYDRRALWEHICFLNFFSDKLSFVCARFLATPSFFYSKHCYFSKFLLTNMDNFEPFCYHCKEVFEHEWGPIKTCDYTHQLLCAVTETKCLCIFEDRESEPVIEYVCGLKGRLDFVKYLHDHRLIFVASKFELMTLQKDNMQRDTYLETDLDIKAIEWSFTEASFIVWNKKENEIVSFGFGDHRFTLLSRISLDTPIPVSGVVEVGSQHAQSQGASAMMHTKDMATNTPPKIIHSNDGKFFHYIIE